MKTISRILQKKYGLLFGRTWCILMLCIMNFILAYGIAIFYNQGKTPVLMIVAGLLTIVLALILSVPNLEPDPDETT